MTHVSLTILGMRTEAPDAASEEGVPEWCLGRAEGGARTAR